MIFSCNRFAIIPHMCNECKQYIWLESYRRADVWKYDRFIMENICKKCLPKFLDVDQFAEITMSIMRERLGQSTIYTDGYRKRYSDIQSVGAIPTLSLFLFRESNNPYSGRS